MSLCRSDPPCQSDASSYFVAVPKWHTVSFCRCVKVTPRAKVTHRVDLTTVSFCRCAILTCSPRMNLPHVLGEFCELIQLRWMDVTFARVEFWTKTFLQERQFSTEFSRRVTFSKWTILHERHFSMMRHFCAAYFLH